MINIDVKVRNGVPPLPIKVTIDKINSDDDMRFSRSGDFSEDFDLVPAEYFIIISGTNPANNGITEAAITGSDTAGNPINLFKSKTVSDYSMIFRIKI